jgi:hypothetical protein
MAQLRATRRWRSPQVAGYHRENRPSKEIPGIGQVSGCPASTKTVGRMGIMSMCEETGCRGIRLDEIRTSDPYHPDDYVVMRMRV